MPARSRPLRRLVPWSGIASRTGQPIQAADAKGVLVKIGQPGSFRREAATNQVQGLVSHAGMRGKESGPVIDLIPAIVSPLRDAPSRFRSLWTVISSLGCGSVIWPLVRAGLRVAERGRDFPLSEVPPTVPERWAPRETAP